MTKISKTDTETVRIQSGAQDMFDSGAAKSFGFSDYIPIIGGEMTELEAVGAFASSGRASVDGDKIVWDDQGEFDDLRPGEEADIAVIWRVLDADGTEIRDSSSEENPAFMEIIARGTKDGTVFINKTTGEVSTDGMTVVAFSAADMLQSVHDFDPVKLVDLDLDIQDLFDVDLGAVTDELADIGELGGLAAKVVGLEAAVGGLKVARDAANEINDLREVAQDAILDLASSGVQITFDTAETVLEGLEDIEKGFKNTIAEAAGIISDVGAFLGDLAGDIAFEAEIKVLEFRAAFGDESAAARIEFLEAQKAKLEKAETDKAEAKTGLENLADGLRNADSAFESAQKALKIAEAEIKAAEKDVREAEAKFNKKFSDVTVGSVDRLKREAEAELKETRDELVEQFEDLQDRGHFQDISSSVDKLAGTLVKLGLGVVKEIDEATVNVLDEIDATAKVDVEVDAFAQAGLIVDFEISGGSVESDLDYDLSSTSVYDTDADTFTVTAQAQSATTGEAIAFDTVSPNMSFFAGIAYNVGANFDFLLELFAEVGGAELFNVGPLEFTKDFAFDGVMSVIDFDSTESEGSDITFPGFAADIFDATVAVPTVQTEGKAEEFSTGPYTDTTTFIDLDKVADVILDLADVRVEFSEEFKALQAKRGAETELVDDSFEAALKQALGTILDSLGEEGDTDGDGFVPILQVKTSEKGADALFHLDTIKDDLSAIDLENGGEFGFFVSTGTSNNLVELRVDVDQLIATAVNVALGNAPDTTENPVDMSIGIGKILDLVGVSEKTQKDVAEVLTLDFNVQVADLDVRTGANFSQEFALSVDDIDFTLTFEDGTTRQVSADEGGEIVVENASGLVDTNGNGQIDYSLALTPDATLFNDTELGMNVGYTLDFLKSTLKLGAGLPLDGIIDGLGSLDAFETSLSFGPVLQLTGDLDVLSADVFESLFEFDAGTGAVEGSFTQAETPDFSIPGRIIGTALADDLDGTDANEKITAKAGDDFIQAGAGRDKVFGGADSDVVFGNEGRDKLKGGKGDDFMSGGEGNDRMIGGKGNDFLQGDSGADVFHFSKGHGENNIADFEMGIDTISIGRGANSIDDLTFAQEGGTAIVTFANVELVIDSTSIVELQSEDVFNF